MFRGRAERKVVEAGYDPARLPPGQYLTEKWPVLHAGAVPDVDLAIWDFAVSGEVDRPIRLSWEEFDALPKREVTEDIHCVTRWSRFDTTFSGVRWGEIEKLVKPREPLTPEHGWPLRLVIPGKYFWKSAKWLREIELSAVDKPGFWERYGYNNDADPFKEERYAF